MKNLLLVISLISICACQTNDTTQPADQLPIKTPPTSTPVNVLIIYNPPTTHHCPPCYGYEFNTTYCCDGSAKSSTIVHWGTQSVDIDLGRSTTVTVTKGTTLIATYTWHVSCLLCRGDISENDRQITRTLVANVDQIWNIP